MYGILLTVNPIFHFFIFIKIPRFITKYVVYLYIKFCISHLQNHESSTKYK